MPSTPRLRLPSPVGTLAVALALDTLTGEPPALVHPVVWIGRLLTFLESRAPGGDLPRLLYGATVALGVPLLCGAAGNAIERLLPWPLQALCLKPTFAGRGLLQAGVQVERSLRRGDLAAARRDLRSLVSRPTDQLDASLVAAAAIESLAENLVDSWVAPLLAYAGFGLGGAYAYRAANTADAMWGYRSPTYEQLGKAAARLDDVLNLIPARLGAAVLVAVGPRPMASLTTWARDAQATASPNAGQSMAVVAGHLQVRLEKPDTYVLNADATQPARRDITRASHVVARAMLATAALTLALRAIRDRCAR